MSIPLAILSLSQLFDGQKSSDFRRFIHYTPHCIKVSNTSTIATCHLQLIL